MDESIEVVAMRNTPLGLVHRVTVTPAGTYLDGPDVENMHRVQRKYPDYPNHFLRVSFGDEDFDSIRHEPSTDRSIIFKERFKDVFVKGLHIAGLHFSFLGFSHSSLREGQCYFMAPFVMNGTLYHAERVIKDLGDFSLIRSPAKCAARIGQAFSDTTESIPVKDKYVIGISDIERNDRVFTDGVGKISRSLLNDVWDAFASSRKNKATILQIRFAGRWSC